MSMSVSLPSSQPAHIPAMTPHPVHRRKKLIEVAIPLEAINAASAREKSIRHGHPSTPAPVVGAATAGGSAGGDLLPDGGRPLGGAGGVPYR